MVSFVDLNKFRSLDKVRLVYTARSKQVNFTMSILACNL